jgi:hypothetical protein
MAVQAFPFLQLTDGTDTVTFADGLGGLTNYPPVRGQWGPSIAGIWTAPLSGRGPYADVEEDLSCNIRDTTASLCWSRLDTLTRLLDKAERWWLRNEPISPVLLKYVPQGSTQFTNASPLIAIVLGRVGNDMLNGVDLPNNVNDAGMLFEIYNIKIKCLRRGAWYGAPQESASSAALANPSVMTVTLPSTHTINSVTDISISGFDKTTTPTIQPGYLIVNDLSSGIQIVEAEGAASGTFTSVADAAGNARGGNVLRFTPGVTTPVTSGTISGLSTIGGTIAILACVRNNSGTTTFQMQANMSGLGTVASSTPLTLIDTSTTNPRHVLLGTMQGSQVNKISFTITASAASGTLDIDYVIIVVLENENCAILAHDAIALTNLGAGAVTLDAVFNPSTTQNPALQASGTGGSIPATYRGPLPFTSISNKVYVVWTATNGASWRFTTTAPAVLSVAATAGRYKQFLSPQ